MAETEDKKILIGRRPDRSKTVAIRTVAAQTVWYVKNFRARN